MSDSSLKVLSVVGAGRSGTTVLASILGEVDGFVSAGELRWLWERGVKAQRPCACGESPSQCEVWSRVVTRTLEELDAGRPGTTLDEVIAAQRQVARRIHLPRVLRSVDGARSQWPELALVQSVTASACSALADVAGARVVVDTSKRAVDAAVLAGAGRFDHYVLHVVRDPRAVVHSWRRAKTFTAAGKTMTMGTRSLASTVRRWTASSLAAEALRHRLPASRWMHLRYEDFARRPLPSIEAILTFMGENGPTTFADDHTVMLSPNHIVAGNPSRFTTGAVTIRADDEWRRRMPRRDQAFVDLATLPLMWRYGYAGARSHADNAPSQGG